MASTVSLKVRISELGEKNTSVRVNLQVCSSALKLLRNIKTVSVVSTVSARNYGLKIEWIKRLPETHKICIITATNKHRSVGLLGNFADCAIGNFSFAVNFNAFSKPGGLLQPTRGEDAKNCQSNNFIHLKVLRVWTKGDLQTADKRAGCVTDGHFSTILIINLNAV